jgi:hypothetical protein
MLIRENPKLIERVEAEADCWIRNDFRSLMKHYRVDAVLSSPFSPATSGCENSWLQGHEEITNHLSFLRTLFPRMKRIGSLFGTTFLVVLMSDREEFLSMHIEPDESGLTRRVIICYSGSYKQLADLIKRARRRRIYRENHSEHLSSTPLPHLMAYQSS